MFTLRFSDDAEDTLERLVAGGNATLSKLKKVRRTLGRLQMDPRYPGLRSHQYENFPNLPNEKVWDSYVENQTASAWRVYWMYGPNEKDENGVEIAVITVLLIGPHL